MNAIVLNSSRIGATGSGKAGFMPAAHIQILIVVLTSVAALALSHPLALGVLCVGGMAYMAGLRRFKLQMICCLALCFMSGLSIVCLYLMSRLLPMGKTHPLEMLPPFLRMMAMFHAIMPLALSVRLGQVLTFMRNLRLPRALYLPLTVTIRFIPGFIADVRQIRDCLRLRGYRGIRLLQPRLCLLPLTFRAMHLSDELAIAAELKGIGYGQPMRRGAVCSHVRRNLGAIAAISLVLTAAVWTERTLPTFPLRFVVAHDMDGRTDRGDP